MTSKELKQFRKRSRMTQADAAKAMGCSVRAISNWENGAHEVPYYIALACAAISYGLRPMGDIANG